jgi:hypothetical protein
MGKDCSKYAGNWFQLLMVLKIIFKKYLWKATGQDDINLEIRKFRWIGHALRKEDEEIPKAALL